MSQMGQCLQNNIPIQKQRKKKNLKF